MVTPYTQSLLLYAYQASAHALTETLHKRGHPAIRPKHGAIFANIDEEGTRASLLAERAGMGKAAMGELIDDLERLGYVERAPDPTDRRAKLVTAGPKARQVMQIVHEFNDGNERRYRELLGEQAYQILRTALRTIAAKDDMQPRMR
ncbi:MarR family winged helix-turn-helix transcriptional regulator [Rhizobium sp. CB3060]|uniref:MarR family winged helix-turn-helix transcriptional regulator n=1 Tax=unclassified Rhizobium TaxID=2613769 RepID=UPI0021A74709|nr:MULTISPECIES: MarR family winged helix-turn-helix transcriptional regulator [Rhizobium]MDK4740696.1 MarR family winged helix-turn-helix transcriptional regulator [Rhizobium sp. CNPSo 3464]UWU21482.1 MarR family winged helix-turn-helix transcriptional regulator [Rhizobium tropici]